MAAHGMLTPPMDLPVELNDLVTLHSSFLTAVSLHYAHNGNASPVDLRALAPSISSIWGRRRVTLDDIKLCLGILSAGAPHESLFRLSDYGYGKICLELAEHIQSRGIMARHIEEEKLNAAFMQALEGLWTTWVEKQMQALEMQKRALFLQSQPRKRGRPRKAVAEQLLANPNVLTEAPTVDAFISRLPLAEITVCESLSKTLPLREKGRKRLQEITDAADDARAQKKTRVAIAVPRSLKNQSTPEPVEQTQAKITSFTPIRRANLLDRILAKQAAQALLPDAPTPAEMARKAALGRAEEVLGVLSMLVAARGGGQRCSFTMAALVQTLQGSVRSPISREEASKVVEVIATEVAPSYVALIRMGTMCNVVVNPMYRPLDLRGNLRSLGVEC
ncbi:uncharacterized protein BDZ99DRAFT_461090 [Mytilinidion resinicola]|uniref:DNA replication factor Cdt1 C-terminal domain-containing protein n=1 Tax=Mytilinidion resinicola TaxID=574789 RepID=A0A6A6YUB3_9PEZI|nr:uncharacterized protein BDZ99DRAFT_461090 [Mytilinidion resinicola]KAF2812371.1 hypothetical protein BDZ99DRAFT_461090 [Mytilinidion resinicola]